MILCTTTTNSCRLSTVRQYMGAFIAYGLPDCSLMSALMKRRMENGGEGEEKVPCLVSASEKIFGSDADFLYKMYFSDNHSSSISKESLLVLMYNGAFSNAMETGCQYHLTIGLGFGFGDAHWLQVEIISPKTDRKRMGATM